MCPLSRLRWYYHQITENKKSVSWGHNISAYTPFVPVSAPQGLSRHGRMAAARLCAQAWLSPHIIHINRGQRLIEIILSVRGRG